MVKEGNKRVMVTISPSTLDKFDELCHAYDMTYSEMLKLMVVDFHIFHQERKK